MTPLPHSAALIALMCGWLAGFGAASGEQLDNARFAIGDPWWDEAAADAPAAAAKPDGPEANDLHAAVRSHGLAILGRQLSIVRQTCPSLEKQQRGNVLEVGRGLVDTFVEEQTQKKRPTTGALSLDLENRIRQALRDTLRANASDAEAAAYEAEQGLRVEREKQAVVAAIVADVDREAWLDDAEREALAEALVESYRKRWQSPASEAMTRGVPVSNETELPGVEQCVEKALGTERKTRWIAARDEARTLERKNRGNKTLGNGVIVMRNGVMRDGGNGGWAVAAGVIEVRAGVVVAGQPAANVIRREVRAVGGGVQMQLEVRGQVQPGPPGGAAPAVEPDTAGARNAAGDDVVVERNDRGVAGPVFHSSFEHQFDAVAFGGVVINSDDTKNTDDNREAVVRRLEPVRQQAEARIAAVDRIVGLSEKQRKKLQFAMESDLRRLADSIAEVRRKYVGRTFTMDGVGLDEASRKAMQEAQEDAGHCRDLIRQACGAESLLAKAIPGALDDAQAKRYASVMDGRHSCRWRATVGIGLSQLDNVVGLTQHQHDVVTAALLASPPPNEDDAAGGPAGFGPANGIVAARLKEMFDDDAEFAAVLDPRQRLAVTAAAAQAAGRLGGGGQMERVILE
jgi:hypothetical protein